MHAEFDAINSIMASLPDEEKDTAFHRQCRSYSSLFLPSETAEHNAALTLASHAQCSPAV